MIRSVNLATGQDIATYQSHDAGQIEELLASSQAAQTSWARQSTDMRSAHLLKVAAALRRIQRLSQDLGGRAGALSRQETISSKGKTR